MCGRHNNTQHQIFSVPCEPPTPASIEVLSIEITFAVETRDAMQKCLTKMRGQPVVRNEVVYGCLFVARKRTQYRCVVRQTTATHL